MIPVLMPSETTQSTLQYNGYGFLKDAIACKVTQELNGVYELEITAPYDGNHISEIEPDMMIKAKAGEREGQQLFRVYRVTKPISEIVKVYAQHISYDLLLNPVEPFSAQNFSTLDALNAVLDSCYYSHNFTAWTDKTTVSSLKFDVPTPARKCLSGMDGSIIDNFGGEFEFDNFLIKLHESRGVDSGTTIYYGKNLTDFLIDTNVQKTYTGIYPYAKNQDEDLITLTEKVIELSNFSSYAEPRIQLIDFSDKFAEGEEITESALRNKVAAYITNNSPDKVFQNLKLSFVQLWQAPEYYSSAPLEEIGLGDTITIRYFKLGVSAKIKIVKTVYDSIKEQYENIEVGTPKRIKVEV